MTVKELIEKLNAIEDKDLQVFVPGQDDMEPLKYVELEKIYEFPWNKNSKTIIRVEIW